MLPINTQCISSIAPNETNSCICSKVQFEDYFIIKKQPRQRKFTEISAILFQLLIESRYTSVVRTLTSGARGPRLDLRR